MKLMRKYVLPVLVVAGLLGSGTADAASLVLTDAWQNLGSGPFLMQTLGGDGVFEASASAPTDAGLALGKNQTPFAYNSTLSVWGKRRSSSYATTVIYSPLTIAGGGGGGGGSVTQGTSPWVDNIAQWAGTLVGAPTNYGTAPTGNAPGVNAYVTNTVAVTWTGQTVAATQSGTWNVNVSNFPTTQGVNNSQVGGNAIATGIGAANTGTQRVALSTDSAIANTAFGISGTLPAFAATPTFNLGTLNGAALDTSVQQVKTALGSPAQIGIAYPLLTAATTNTSGSASPVSGSYYFNLSGTFGGGTVTLTSTVNGVTTTVGTYTTASSVSLSVYAGTTLTATLSGATSPSITASLNGGPAPPAGTVFNTTTSGDTQPARAPSGKITKNSTALTANTSTQIAPANANRIALVIQCTAGGLEIDETGSTLTSATSGGTLFIPTAQANNPYAPPIATLTAVTAYGAAQTCTVTEYNR